MKILLIAAFLLAGCTPVAQDVGLRGAGLASDALYADSLIQSGRVESSILSVELSESDLEAVITAFDDYAQSRAVLEDVVKNPVQAMAFEQALLVEHDRLVDAYLSLSAVVARNWDAYSAVDRSRLSRWQAQAERLEVNYQNFMAAAEMAANESARAAQYLSAARAVAQIAVMAL